MQRLTWTQRLFRISSAGRLVCCAVALCITSTASAQDRTATDPPGSDVAETPWFRQIDQVIERDAIGPLAAKCSDTEFIRRVSIDLTGQIPSAEKTRSFAADINVKKREELVDGLLMSDEFIRHLTQQLNVMFLERRTDKYVPEPDWERYLVESVMDNKPLDQMYRELLSPPAIGDDWVAAKFILNRDAEPNAVTREVGRMAFGVDMQCAQCHDHPLIEDYYQDDYYGLYAFVQRTGQYTDPKTKKSRLSEKPDGSTSFKSVFTGDGRDDFLPRLPKGSAVWQEPSFAKGEEYAVAPQKNVPGTPKYSRREILAQMLADNRLFQRNLANRLWSMMIGRGLVHPLDHHHAANPPSHPELLNLLSKQLTASHFDARSFLKSIALTRTYQRSCEPPAPESINQSDISARLQLLQQQRHATESSINQFTVAAEVSNKQLDAAIAHNDSIDQQVAELEKQVKAAQEQLQNAQASLKLSTSSRDLIQQQLSSLKEVRKNTADAVAQTSEQQLLIEAQTILDKHIAAVTSNLKTAEARLAESNAGMLTAQQDVHNAQQPVTAALALRTAVSKQQDLESIKLTTAHQLTDATFRVRQIDASIALCQSLLDYAQARIADPVAAEQMWLSLVERLTINCQIAALKPLTPEQLAASMMQATDAMAPHVAAVEASLKKAPPKVDENANQTVKDRAYRTALNTSMINRTRTTFRQFVTFYGGLPGEDFQATAGQALFFGNGSVIDAWLKPSATNLSARLNKLTEPHLIADELYLAIFSRNATADEQQDVRELLSKYPEQKQEILNELIWGMLSSTEFRFNH